MCKAQNPEVAFNLEMITRDPLKVPCLKSDFWKVFEGVPASDLARTLRMVKENKFQSALPTVSQLSVEERLAVEEDNVVQSLTFSQDKLKLT
jgi:hypothetical protein